MASRNRLTVSQTRKGRRPLKVSTMLRKEKEGTLYKYTKLGYTLQGHTDVQGLNVAIENRKGSVRKGTDSDGHEWKTKMKHPYGYLVGTKGADGEPVDAYVGPDRAAPNAFVVHQHKDTGKGYDEDKVMLGFKGKAEAQKGYLKHYDDKKFLGPTSTVPVERLKEMVGSKKKLVKISEACFDELMKLNAISRLQYEAGQLKKKPRKPVTRAQATKSLKRLRGLESTKATVGELGRSAGVGAAVGPAAAMAYRVAAGSKGRAGLPIYRGMRDIGAIAAQGGVIGSLLPAGRHKLEREAEKQKLREYVGQRKRGTLRSKIKRTTGV